jgi:hypothetical protein
MKSSKKDKWLDQLISRAAATDKPIPNFDKWLKEHPNAVQSLKARVEHLQIKSSPRRKSVSREPLFVRFPRLTWACCLAGLFLIVISWLVSFVLTRENRMLRQDLQFARQEIAVLNRQQQNEESQDSQQRVVSSLQLGVQDLEDQMLRCKSPRMVYYAEIPYYSPEGLGEL